MFRKTEPKEVASISEVERTKCILHIAKVVPYFVSARREVGEEVDCFGWG
jgi:hypothetical protein